jgi:hypothetical protein
MAITQKSIAFQPKGQRLFNERLKPKTHNPNGFDVVNSPWLSNEAVNRLPPVQRDFEQSRDPKAIRPSPASGTQQWGEQAGRGSAMIKQDQPKPVLKPHNGMAQNIDNKQFNSRWLAEQRASAMQKHRPATQAEQPQLSPSRQYRGPSR